MTHLFKINLQQSDMFVRSIDLKKGKIKFEIRDKDTGNLLEPVSNVSFKVADNKIHMGNRFISYPLAAAIEEILQ